MRAALLFTLLLTLACLASGNSVPSFVRQDKPLCNCFCRPGRRGRRLAFRECRRSNSIHCEVTRCDLPSGRRGWWCCDDIKVSPTPEDDMPTETASMTPSVTPSISMTASATPSISMTASVTPSISMTPGPSVTPGPFPKQPGVLCLRSCGVCENFGCRRRDGGRDGCCPRFIRTADNSCDDNPPPCVLN